MAKCHSKAHGSPQWCWRVGGFANIVKRAKLASIQAELYLVYIKLALSMLGPLLALVVPGSSTITSSGVLFIYGSIMY